MKRSLLHHLNESLGARFVPFGGWEMPLQYESVLGEHRAVRSAAGVFDVSHLGRFALSGPGSHVAIQRRLCNDIERIEPGRCQYTMILNSDGGIIDDLIVWWWAEHDFWLMPNAANHERVMEAFGKEPDCEVIDLQTDTVFLALQGPKASNLISQIVGEAPGRFRNRRVDWDGSVISMAGTGYTGEDGAEICVDPETGARLMRALIEADATPCGLGSRDTLRLEAGLALWGEDIDETSTPYEAGLGFAVSLDHPFVGRDRLVGQKAGGVERRLTGFVLEDRGIPRHGHEVRASGGGVGAVTSGNLSPMLDRGIGLAYLSPPPQPDETLEVDIRGRWVPARIAKPPFHQS
ncbi:MAG TPA: glycine cleavage system aminomethyltransferase GcvT [Acidimicrobiia bacterium]|jgi:aminomethyltransferase